MLPIRQQRRPGVREGQRYFRQIPREPESRDAEFVIAQQLTVAARAQRLTPAITYSVVDNGAAGAEAPEGVAILARRRKIHAVPHLHIDGE